MKGTLIKIVIVLITQVKTRMYSSKYILLII
jgi:hypothetical protein